MLSDTTDVLGFVDDLRRQARDLVLDQAAGVVLVLLADDRRRQADDELAIVDADLAVATERLALAQAAHEAADRAHWQAQGAIVAAEGVGLRAVALAREASLEPAHARQDAVTTLNTARNKLGDLVQRRERLLTLRAALGDVRAPADLAALRSAVRAVK